MDITLLGSRCCLHEQISKEDIFHSNLSCYHKAGIIDDAAEADAKVFVSSSHDILVTILDSLSSSLEIEAQDYLPGKHRKEEHSGDHLRIVKYSPAARKDEGPPEVLLVPHTDFGTLTILHTTHVGLQILDPDTAIWKYVEPRADAAVVMVGDALVKFTNGVLRSCQHRVVSPPAGNESETANKYSVGYFLRPEDGVLLHALNSPLIQKSLDNDINAILSQDWTAQRVQASKVTQFDKGRWNLLKGTAVGWKS